MKKKLLTAALCAAALCSVGSARANTITFDNPGEVTIDNNTDIATYVEAGFAFSGPAASFLPLEDSLVAGFDTTPLVLTAVGGGAFSLASLDDAFFDFGFGTAPGSLTVTGLLNGMQVASTVLALGDPVTSSFGASFVGVTEVDFSGTSGFSLDNVNASAVAAVPEPSTVALCAIGLFAVMTRVRLTTRARQSRRAAGPAV